MNEDDNKEGNENYFFWLGEDGELKPVTEEQFSREIDNVREGIIKWREVDIEWES